MPVKLWDRDNSGTCSSTILTTRRNRLGGEEFREEANALDEQIDSVLDRAAELSSIGTDKNSQFVKRWAIGRAVAESKLLTSPLLEPDERRFLWSAMAVKCRLGIRASGKESEQRWGGLIPKRHSEPSRIKRDIFALGYWLQEQEQQEALATFGGNLKNAGEIQRRETLRSKRMRAALSRWFFLQDPDQRAYLFEVKQFTRIAKALRTRWPSRGPGSAKRPEHFTADALDDEIRRVLAPMAKEAASSLRQHRNQTGDC